MASLVPFHSINRTKDFSISIFIDYNCHKNGYIFKHPAPVAVQLDSIHIDIQIAFVL